MNPLISVIIPIYKVEKYLRRSIESVLNQTYRNLDIILVDDGSPDHCGQICDYYAKTQARVRVIHKENGGLSDARNAGLAVAGGDYIAFLDSDDYYSPYFIEILYQQIVNTGAEVAVCSYEVTQELEPEDGPDFQRDLKQYQMGRFHPHVYDRKRMLLNQYDAICQDATYFIVAWNKLYKASLFRKVRFPKGKIHEDEATTYRIFDQIEKGVYLRMPLYAYYQMEDSITRKSFSKKRLDWLDALDDRIAFFEEKAEYDIVSAATRARADGAIRYFDLLIQNEKKISAEKKRMKQCVKQALNLHRRHKEVKKDYLTSKNRLGYRLFLLCPSLYVKLLFRDQKG